MPCNRFCRKCGLPLDCDHEGDVCYMCLSDTLAPGCDDFPWEGDLQDVEEDEDKMLTPEITHVRG